MSAPNTSPPAAPSTDNSERRFVLVRDVRIPGPKPYGYEAGARGSSHRKPRAGPRGRPRGSRGAPRSRAANTAGAARPPMDTPPTFFTTRDYPNIHYVPKHGPAPRCSSVDSSEDEFMEEDYIDNASDPSEQRVKQEGHRYRTVPGSGSYQTQQPRSTNPHTAKRAARSPAGAGASSGPKRSRGANYNRDDDGVSSSGDEVANLRYDHAVARLEVMRANDYADALTLRADALDARVLAHEKQLKAMELAQKLRGKTGEHARNGVDHHDE